MYKWCLSRPSTNRYRCCFATHCNTLLHTATHCYTLQHTHILTIYIHIQWCPSRPSTHPISLLLCDYRCCFATHCNTLLHTATHCNTLQHAATRCNTLQHTHIVTMYIHIYKAAPIKAIPRLISLLLRAPSRIVSPPPGHTHVFSVRAYILCS